VLEEYKTKTNKDHNKNQQKIFFGLVVSWPLALWPFGPLALWPLGPLVFGRLIFTL